MIIDCFSLFGFINLWLLSISLYTLYSGRIEDFWQKYSPFFLWSGPQLLHSQVWFCRQWCMLTIGTVEGCPFFSRVVSLNFLWLLRNFPTIRISALDGVVVWLYFRLLRWFGFSLKMLVKFLYFCVVLFVISRCFLMF